MKTITEHLAETNQTRRAFADEIGIHESVLSRFINGKAKPSLTTAVAIERATGGAVPASSWVDQIQEDI